MRFLSKIILAVVVNAFALWGAANYIGGFVLAQEFRQILTIAVIFTALNLVLKPILKLVLGPIIILTLGLGILIVNALLLYILDLLSKNLTIETIPALIYGTILITLINFIFHFANKK